MECNEMYALMKGITNKAKGHCEFIWRLILAQYLEWIKINSIFNAWV